MRQAQAVQESHSYLLLTCEPTQAALIVIVGERLAYRATQFSVGDELLIQMGL